MIRREYSHYENESPTRDFFAPEHICRPDPCSGSQLSLLCRNRLFRPYPYALRPPLVGQISRRLRLTGGAVSLRLIPGACSKQNLFKLFWCEQRGIAAQPFQLFSGKLCLISPGVIHPPVQNMTGFLEKVPRSVGWPSGYGHTVREIPLFASLGAGWCIMIAINFIVYIILK